ncbi:MAG TPA: hypothetical protein VG795_08110 [Acidimicrobiia bacterium]|nr:hypothetical protein [Acidimicrobiia bacterium]
MKGKLAVLAAATFTVVAASVAPAGAASSYGPGQYKKGPHNGDPSVIVSEADPATGKVTILQRNTRQAAAVNCVGDGPRATLLALHQVTDAVTSVQVDYTEAYLSDNEIIIHVAVRGDRSGALAARSAHGPKMNETGSVTVPLRNTPQPGETLTVQVGLQTGAGCLPHPQLGLDGSRFVNGGQAIFSAVKVG